MSKRRNRKQQASNLPQEMLERARQQFDSEDDDEGEEAVVVEAKAPSPTTEPRPAASKATTPVRSRSARRPGLQSSQSRGERKTDSSDTQYIRNRLANPTRFVTPEQLRSEYGYVIHDLRTMGILAAVLVVVMVVVEKLL